MPRTEDDALTEKDYETLGSILDRFKHERAMNLEELDGFFAALACAPIMTMPSRYIPEIWGGEEQPDDDAFEDEEQLKRFTGLAIRLWNAITNKLGSKEVFLPYLLEDSDGIAHGNDWAKGFLRGMKMEQFSWMDLVDDEEQGGVLVPIVGLAHEHDPDPAMQPFKGPVTPEQREGLILGLAAGAMRIHDYYAPQRRAAARALREEHTIRRDVPKTGRNEPCPCGSGRKYKQCCGANA